MLECPRHRQFECAPGVEARRTRVRVYRRRGLRGRLIHCGPFGLEEGEGRHISHRHAFVFLVGFFRAGVDSSSRSRTSRCSAIVNGRAAAQRRERGRREHGAARAAQQHTSSDLRVNAAG